MEDEVLDTLRSFDWRVAQGQAPARLQALSEGHPDLRNLSMLERHLGQTLPSDVRTLWTHGGTNIELRGPHGTLGIDTSKWITELSLESPSEVHLGYWTSEPREEDVFRVYYTSPSWALFRGPRQPSAGSGVLLAPTLLSLLRAIEAGDTLGDQGQVG